MAVETAPPNTQSRPAPADRAPAGGRPPCGGLRVPVAAVSTVRPVSLLLLFIWLAALLAACAQPQATQALVRISLEADGQTLELTLPAGSTVEQAMTEANLELNELDRVEPPAFTVLGNGAKARIVRVSEEFEISTLTLPFQQQTLRNESLPVDTEVLIQKGQNGLQEITYRVVYEDGLAVNDQPTPVKSVIVKEPVPEIRMIGVQTPFAPVEIPGQMLYLRDGSVWRIQGSTGQRQAVLTLGDLDGRVLSLSEDGDWLLFTRRAEGNEQINSLWAANISGLEPAPSEEDDTLIDLKVANVLHFADWVPGFNDRVIFSTVEPRATAPGWQANNDLQMLTFSPNGWTTKWVTIIEANSGGVYGWWGTHYAWGPDRRTLAYARPGGIGLVDYKTGAVTSTLEIIPYQARGDWAWVPGISWGPDGKTLFSADHPPAPGSLSAGMSAEQSPAFNLNAILMESGTALPLALETGMFAYPQASPLQPQPGDVDYRLAYLQAIFPEQSETSRYRLVVMDRDGSNRQTLFPAEDSPGLAPQQHWGAWSPAPMPASSQFALAVLHQGNLFLVDAVSGEAIQVTGDGLTTRVIWR